MNQNNKNKGFSLVELLVAIAILSIVMLMVTQFMGSTSAAHRKTQNNLKVQNEANEVMTNIFDTLMKANYVRISPKETSIYQVGNAADMEVSSRVGTISGESLTSDKLAQISFDLVSDNYTNVIRPVGTPERKVIVNFDTYQMIGETGSAVLPLASDLDPVGDVRSFRLLKKNDTYYYIKPEYIYCEYYTTLADGTQALQFTIYRFVYNGEKCKVYLYRSPDTANYESNGNRFHNAKSAVDLLASAGGRQRLLTEDMQDLYLSADAEGNALLFDAVFNIGGYKYNAVDTMMFRNSDVLTVRPQNMYKVSGTGVTPP